MLSKKELLLFILTMAIPLSTFYMMFATNSFASNEPVVNEFVSVLYTATGQRGYRDIAHARNLVGMISASDAPLEDAWGKLLVNSNNDNSPSKRYIERVAHISIDNINESGVLVSHAREIVSCDVIYPPAPGKSIT